MAEPVGSAASRCRRPSRWVSASEAGRRSDSRARWTHVAAGTTIGRKRIARFQPMTLTGRVRVSITKSRACPTLATIAVHLAPVP